MNSNDRNKQNSVGLFSATIGRAEELYKEGDPVPTTGCPKTIWENFYAFLRSLFPGNPATVEFDSQTLKDSIERFNVLMRSNPPVPTAVCHFYEAAETQLQRYKNRTRHSLKLPREVATWINRNSYFATQTGGNLDLAKLTDGNPTLKLPDEGYGYLKPIAGGAITGVAITVAVLFHWRKLLGWCKRCLSDTPARPARRGRRNSLNLRPDAQRALLEQGMAGNGAPAEDASPARLPRNREAAPGADILPQLRVNRRGR